MQCLRQPCGINRRIGGKADGQRLAGGGLTQQFFYLAGNGEEALGKGKKFPAHRRQPQGWSTALENHSAVAIFQCLYLL